VRFSRLERFQLQTNFRILLVDTVGAQDYDYAMSILHNDYEG
jgi:hypothetical protein